MKKIKGLGAVVVSVLLAPEFRPTEIRIARAIGVAVAAYLGIKYV